LCYGLERTLKRYKTYAKIRLTKMSEEKQIEDLKTQFRRTTDSELRRKMLDTISAYKNNGIDAINELISSTIDDELKSHGLNLIKKIKQNS
jgi:hypothetical protein